MFGKLLLSKCVAHATYLYHRARYSVNSSTNLYIYLVLGKYRMCHLYRDRFVTRLACVYTC